MASSTETGVKLLSPVVESPSKRWETGPVFGPVLAWGVLGLVAFVIEVLLLGGLKGTASGISAGINALTTLGAVLTQLLFVGGVILTVHLEVVLLRSRAPWLLRALSVPVTSVLCTLLMNAAVAELAALPLVMVGVLGALLALAAGTARVTEAPFVPAEHHTASRRTGTLLIVAALSALLWGAARVSAWQTTTLETPPFHAWSPWLASAAWATSGALTSLALATLARASRRRQAPLLGMTTLATLVSWTATRPQSFDEPTWHVFLVRAVQGLLRTPLPVVPPSLVLLEHLLGLAAAAWAFAHRALPPSQRIVLGFCLLALRAPDTPLLALVLTLGALWAALPTHSQQVTQQINERV